MTLALARTHGLPLRHLKEDHWHVEPRGRLRKAGKPAQNCESGLCLGCRGRICPRRPLCETHVHGHQRVTDQRGVMRKFRRSVLRDCERQFVVGRQRDSAAHGTTKES